jgi:hypothetical protein
MPIRCVYNEAELARIRERQHGVVTRSQALKCGMSKKAIRYVLGKPGGWSFLLPGVYLTSPGAPTLDQRYQAALLYAGPGSVITGVAALRLHGVRYQDPAVIDVLVPDSVQHVSTGFVRILRSRRMPGKFRVKEGIRFAYLPRAVGDAARALRGFRQVQALVCAVLQQTSCTVELLAAELNDGPSAGSKVFRAALYEVSDGVRSAAEGDLKRLIDRSDIEKPLYNPKLYLPDGTFLCCPDLWWERYGVAGEVDSLAYHFTAKDYEDTTMRHNRIERTGIHLLHWLPRTIQSDGQTVLTDIRSALADAANRTPPKIITVPGTQGHR